MDVLEELSDPELDTPEEAVQKEASAEEPAPDALSEEAVLDTSAEVLAQEASAPEEEPEAPYPGEEEVISALRKRTRIRPELIMGILAGLAAAVLLLVVVLSFPYFGAKDEDPEALPQRHEEARPTEVVQETILEPTISETEPETPTIPPDRNPYDRYDFQYNRQNYLVLINGKSYPGVDVSAYQGEIDWKRVATSGIHFAMIRLGYRGYESGKLVEDKYAQANLEGARAAGLKVGAYFFSQALNIKETDQEMAFIQEVLGDFELDMPLVLDWEIPDANARTKNMDAQTLTDIQRHFCGQMKEKGYQPMVYFNWHQSENLYTLYDLEEYPFWLALYQDRMTYPWKVEMWQYTDKGKVPGISGNVDLNVYIPD